MAARLRKPPPLVELLRGWGLTAKRLSGIIGSSTVTANRRLAVPEKLDVEELRKLHRAGMDVEDLASAVFGVRLERRKGA